MNQIKIAFFDIDGTLIDMERKAVSGKTLETLRRLQENGTKICIATGRSPIEVPAFPDIRFDSFMTFNGSYCFTGSKTIFSNPIPREDVRKLIENAERMGHPVTLATKDRLASNGSDKDLADYHAVSDTPVIVADDFDEVASEADVYQIMMGGRSEEYPAIIKNVEGAEITAWWDRAVDIIPKGGGKGLGVKKVLEFYGLDKSEAIAFGDGDNDIAMFKAVGNSVAMANASENLRRVATDSCGHVRDDGIYHYCLENGLV